MKNTMKKFISITMALSVMLGVASCGAPSTATPANSEADTNANAAGKATGSKGSVMMYSSMQEDQLVAIKEAFEKKYPDIKMEYYFAGTSKVITKIATEAQAGQVDADVIWVGDPADYISFKKQNILQKYVSPEAGNIDAKYQDAEGFYTGARMMNMGIAYNTTLVSAEEAPKSWNDLLDAKWNDQIVMTDPGSSGTSKYWMNALMSSDKYGEQYIKALKENGCYLESGTTACHNQLAASAYKVGVCLDYVTANLAQEGSPIAFVYPEDTVSIFSPIGLVANCANEENGKLLYDFILSKEGQEVLVKNNLISVRSDVDQGDTDVHAIAEKAIKSDLNKMSENAEKYSESFDKIFGI